MARLATPPLYLLITFASSSTQLHSQLLFHLDLLFRSDGQIFNIVKMFSSTASRLEEEGKQRTFKQMTGSANPIQLRK
ncbi:hypothetical protein K1719_046818 [Acacia pycnantha]|nr:hypothetical protein K1719_046818 [Acacia pycnantha]